MASASASYPNTTSIRSSMAQSSAADLKELTYRHGPFGNFSNTRGKDSAERWDEKRRRHNSGPYDSMQSSFAAQEIQPPHAQFRNVISPLTLLNQSPRIPLANLTEPNDQAREDRPCTLHSHHQQPSMNDIENPTNLLSTSEYHSMQSGDAEQFIKPKNTSTTPHNALYNDILTPKVNANDQIPHNSRWPISTFNQESQFSLIRDQNDTLLAKAQQILTEPIVPEVSAFQKLHPFTEIGNSNLLGSIHQNWGSASRPMHEKITQSAPRVITKDVLKPYQEDHCRHYHTNSKTPNLIAGSLAKNSGNSTNKRGLNKYSVPIDSSTVIGHESLRGDHQISSSISEADGQKLFGSTIPFNRSSDYHHQTHRLDDGELDRRLSRIPAPQLAPGIRTSPTRTRITLPPRGPSVCYTPRPRTGISANIRSSAATPQSSVNLRPHREQLGTIESRRLPSMSPYFAHQQIPSTGLHNATPQIAYSKPRSQMRGFSEGLNTPGQPYIGTANLTPATRLKSRSNLFRDQLYGKAGSRKQASTARFRRRAQR